MVITDLVIGGTSGLGSDIAELMAHDNEVIVAGRHDSLMPTVEFCKLDLAQGPNLYATIGRFVAQLPEISALVYAPGFYQEGRITEVSPNDAEAMLDVCYRGLWEVTRALLQKQGRLDELIVVTSTFQRIPRKLEPGYCAAKAAAGMLANCLAEDERVGKVMVAAPGGMATPFWTEAQREKMGQLLDPRQVARQMMDLREGDYSYKEVVIPRQTGQPEVIEER